MFKILVVEDDRELNKTVCSFLNHSGYEAVGEHYLLPIEGQTQTFRQTFSITAAG